LKRPAPAPPRVVAIVVNFNGGAMLRDCVASLTAQTHRPHRVLVVDNASTDGSVDGLEAAHEGVTVIRSAVNLGFAAGNNRALAMAGDCDWIALLNPDAVADPHWLERLLAGAARHPQAALLGCRMLADREGARLDGVGDAYHVSGLPWRTGHGEPAAGRHLQDTEIFAPCAAAALYRTDLLRALGGFDEDFFCYVEDVDLGFRARLLGHRAWYVADAQVVHAGSGLVGRHSDFQLYHGHRNLVWSFVRNMPWPLLLAYLPLHLLLTAVTLAVFARRGRAGVMLRAKRDALRGLPRCWAKRRATQATRRASAAALRAAMQRGLPRRPAAGGPA
jgi:GT2 family glycosyltransferase